MSSDTTDAYTYTCPCGTVHRVSPWTAAHCSHRLAHQCRDCGRQNDIRNGAVLNNVPPSMPQKMRKQRYARKKEPLP
jgi:hypothetical protein